MSLAQRAAGQSAGHNTPLTYYDTDHVFAVVPELFVQETHTQTTFIKELEASLIHNHPSSSNLLIVEVHRGERPNSPRMLRLKTLEVTCLSHMYGFSLSMASL